MGGEAADRARPASDAAHLPVDLDVRGACLEMGPERPLALVADEQDRRRRVEATIMYGRGARSIACDAFTSFVTVWFG